MPGGNFFQQRRLADTNYICGLKYSGILILKDTAHAGIGTGFKHRNQTAAGND